MTHDDRDVERVADAIRLSQARDDEGQFAALGDLLGFSGENAARTVCREAARAALSAMPHAELLREAMEALEPFEVFGQILQTDPAFSVHADDMPVSILLFSDGVRRTLTFGDLRRARAAAQRLRDAMGGG